MNEGKNICRKIESILEYLIGILLAICLFVGGLGFIGYMVAFIIGGELATEMSAWLYRSFYGFLIRLSTITTLASFVLIYLKGDVK